jgi:hypothetical protein
MTTHISKPEEKQQNSKLDRSLDSINMINHKKPPLRNKHAPGIVDQSLTGTNFGAHTNI